MDKTRGFTIGIQIARQMAPNIAPKNELIKAAPRARPASPFFAKRMAINKNGGGDCFSWDPKEDRGDVTRGGINSRHPKEKRKGLDRAHREDKRKHQGQSDWPANPRQDSHYESDADPHQLQSECLPGKELDQAVETGIQDYAHRWTPDVCGARPRYRISWLSESCSGARGKSRAPKTWLSKNSSGARGRSCALAEGGIQFEPTYFTYPQPPQSFSIWL